MLSLCCGDRARTMLPLGNEQVSMPQREVKAQRVPAKIARRITRAILWWVPETTCLAGRYDKSYVVFQ
jgi:hypothetical protein